MLSYTSSPLSKYVSSNTHALLNILRRSFPTRRGTPLSEKLLRGEDWREGAPRAIAEELGSALTPGYVLQVDEDSLVVSVVERDSLSYPGLPSRYTMHSVEAKIENGFASGDDEGFTSVEETNRGKLTATWVWQEGYSAEEGGSACGEGGAHASGGGE